MNTDPSFPWPATCADRVQWSHMVEERIAIMMESGVAEDVADRWTRTVAREHFERRRAAPPHVGGRRR